MARIPTTQVAQPTPVRGARVGLIAGQGQAVSQIGEQVSGLSETVSVIMEKRRNLQENNLIGNRLNDFEGSLRNELIEINKLKGEQALNVLENFRANKSKLQQQTLSDIDPTSNLYKKLKILSDDKFLAFESKVATYQMNEEDNYKQETFVRNVESASQTAAITLEPGDVEGVSNLIGEVVTARKVQNNGFISDADRQGVYDSLWVNTFKNWFSESPDLTVKMFEKLDKQLEGNLSSKALETLRNTNKVTKNLIHTRDSRTRAERKLIEEKAYDNEFERIYGEFEKYRENKIDSTQLEDTITNANLPGEDGARDKQWFTDQLAKEEKLESDSIALSEAREDADSGEMNDTNFWRKYKDLLSDEDMKIEKARAKEKFAEIDKTKKALIKKAHKFIKDTLKRSDPIGNFLYPEEDPIRIRQAQQNLDNLLEVGLKAGKTVKSMLTEGSVDYVLDKAMEGVKPEVGFKIKEMSEKFKPGEAKKLEQKEKVEQLRIEAKEKGEKPSRMKNFLIETVEQPLGALEVGIAMTGEGAKLVHSLGLGLSGMVVAAKSGADEAAEFISDVNEVVSPYLTYEPKTDAGKRGMKVIHKFFELFSDAGRFLGAETQGLVDPIAGKEAGIVAATTVDTFFTALPLFIHPAARTIKGKMATGKVTTPAEVKAFEEILGPMATELQKNLTRKYKNEGISDVTLEAELRGTLEGEPFIPAELPKPISEVKTGTSVKTGAIKGKVKETSSTHTKVETQPDVTITVPNDAKTTALKKIDKPGVEPLAESIQKMDIETAEGGKLDVKSRHGNIIDIIKSEEGSVDIKAFRDKLSKSLGNLTERTYFAINKPESDLYQTVGKLTDNQRIERNLAALLARDVKENMVKNIPENIKSEITFAIDEGRVLPDAKAEAAKTKISSVFNLYKAELKKEGILRRSVDDYVNHIVIEDPNGFKLNETRFTKPRVVKSTTKGPKGETIDEFFKIKELQELGYKVETDITKLLPTYVYHAERSLARKRFMNSLNKTKDEFGNSAVLTESEVPREFKHLYKKIDADILNRWMGIRPGDVIKGGKVDVYKGNTMIHVNAWDAVDNLMISDRASHPIGLAYVKARALSKRLIMINPMVHGFNVESNTIMLLGTDYIKALATGERFKVSTRADIKQIERFAVESGLELEGLFDFSRRLEQDIYEPNLVTERTKPIDVIKHPVDTLMKRPFHTIKDVSDFILWDKFVKTGQILNFMTLAKRFQGKGMGKVEAGRAAAMVTNDAMGTLPMTWFTRNQRKALRGLMFAPSWNIGLLRTLSGATGIKAGGKFFPKPLRLEGLNDTQLKAMGSEYRKMVIKGVIGMYASANAAQYLFLTSNGKPFHPIWQNEEGHKLDIDTGLFSADGITPLYVKNWGFRQIDDYAKITEPSLKNIGDTLRNKMEPILRSVIEVISNQSLYNGQPISDKGAGTIRWFKDMSLHLITGLTAIETFVPREDEVRTILETVVPLTGSWVLRGMPTLGNKEMANILREFYEFNERLRFMKGEARDKATKLIKQGKDEEALAMVYSKELTPGQFEGIMKNHLNPVFNRIGSGNKLNTDFILYMLSKTPSDRQHIERVLTDVKRDTVLRLEKERK